jgi:hypothetical protein
MQYLQGIGYGILWRPASKGTYFSGINTSSLLTTW